MTLTYAAEVESTDVAARSPVALTWHVACVKSLPGAEERFAEELAARGITCRVPAVDVVAERNGKRVYRRRLLLKGYLPIAVESDVQLAEVRDRDRYEHQRIWNVLPVNDQQKFIRQMEHFDTASDRGCILNTYPFLIPGRRVRVADGPLRGAECILDRVGGGKVYLLWQTLQSCAEVEVPASMVEPC